MKRLLVVSPHFPPANGADMHRVRAVLPFLTEFGWAPHVLAVNPEIVAVPRDAWLTEGIPSDIPVEFVSGLGLKWSVIPGLGSLDFRAILTMKRAGLSILRQHKFDLVYLSTTVFSMHTLAPYWKRKTGVPFVIDYQDPWVNDYYRDNPGVVPPGGRFKYAIMSLIHAINEARVLRECSAITAVSPAYPEQLKRRYPKLRGMPSEVLQFPVAVRDFERIHNSSVRQSIFSPDDGLRHWVYIGRGGPDMAKSTKAIFTALRVWKDREPNEYARTRLHFAGTSYAPEGKGERSVIPIAQACEVADVVTESTDRIPFSSMLKCLLDADALIVPGSDDTAYTASKLLPYLVAGKPVLTVFHEQSPTRRLIGEIGGAQCVKFASNDTNEVVADRVNAAWFAERRYETKVPLDAQRLQPYTDRGQAMMLSRFFSTIA